MKRMISVIISCAFILCVAGLSFGQNAATHIKRGEALEKKGDLDSAIAEYREALRLRPADAMIPRSRTDAHIADG